MARGVSRDLEKEFFWRGVIGEWAGSGLTVSGFCRREGISANNFFRWRRVLEERDREQAVESEGPSVVGFGSGCSGADPFARVSVVAGGSRASLPANSDGPFIEVVLPGGDLVRVRPGFDSDTLARLLGLLTGRRC